MLKLLRNKKLKKRLLIGLAVIIVPAFAFWGASSVIRGKKEAVYAGVIRGSKIPFTDYIDAQKAVRNRLIIQFGDEFSQMQQYFDIESQAWDRLILLSQAKRERINAGDKEIVGFIRKLPIFSKGGRFDKDLYSQLLRYVFYAQPRVFEEQMRQNIILSKLHENHTKDITLDDAEIKEAYKKETQSLSIYYIASLNQEAAQDIVIGDEELKEYFKNYKLEFKLPPSFDLEYILMPAEDQRSQTEAKIREILPMLNSKDGLGPAAAQLKVEVNQTGPFAQTDIIPGIGYSQELLQLISRLKVGEFSPPVFMDGVYYILRLTDRKGSYIPEFENIKDQILKVALEKKTKDIARQKLKSCLQSLDASSSKPVNLKGLAKEFALKYGVTGMFKYGSYIEDIGASDEFWMTAVDLEGGAISKVIEVASGFYAIKLKSKESLDEKEFLENKEVFSENLLLLKKQESFAQFLESLRRNSQRF
ncbi:SurA N-terminal domain-containing protein [Candidatus Omnitrophota bacterium]